MVINQGYIQSGKALDSVTYKRATVPLSTARYKNGVIIFTADRKYGALIVVPARQGLAPCMAMLQKDGTYLANYTSSEGVEDPEPDILLVTESNGVYSYDWPVDWDGLGLNYVGSTVVCFYAE